MSWRLSNFFLLFTPSWITLVHFYLSRDKPIRKLPALWWNSLIQSFFVIWVQPCLHPLGTWFSLLKLGQHHIHVCHSLGTQKKLSTLISHQVFCVFGMLLVLFTYPSSQIPGSSLLVRKVQYYPPTQSPQSIPPLLYFIFNFFYTYIFNWMCFYSFLLLIKFMF